MSRSRKASLAVLVSVGILCVAFFQNCAPDFQIADEVSTADATVFAYKKQDGSMLADLVSLNEYVGFYNYDKVVLGVGRTIIGLTNAFQPAFDASSHYDLNPVVPGFLPTESTDAETGRSLFSQSPSTDVVAMTTSGSDIFTSEEISLVMMLKKPLAGDIVSVNDGARKSEDFQIRVEGNQILARKYSTATTYSTVTVALPDSDRFIIAASFGTTPDKIRLMVNGVSSIDAVKTGSPADAAYLLRRFQVGPSESGGHINWGEAQVFLKELTGYQLSVLSRSMGDRWNIRNVVDDLSLRADLDVVSPVAPAGAITFADLIGSDPTKAIFAQRCYSCHGPGQPNQSTLDLTSYTQAKSKAAVIQSRMNNGASPMPSSGLLSPSERAVVDQWITDGKWKN